MITYLQHIYPTVSCRKLHTKLIFLALSSMPADINECVSGVYDCHWSASCTNTLGSYSCSCNHPYIGNGKICTHPAAAKSTLTVYLFFPINLTYFIFNDHWIFKIDDIYNDILGYSNEQEYTWRKIKQKIKRKKGKESILALWSLRILTIWTDTFPGLLGIARMCTRVTCYNVLV